MFHFRVHGKTYVLKFKRQVALNKPRGEGSHVTQRVTSSELTTLSVIGLGFVTFIERMHVVYKSRFLIRNRNKSSPRRKTSMKRLI